jgi:voltage-gated potassium channel
MAGILRPYPRPAVRRRGRMVRGLRASWRDTLVLLREFRTPLLALVVVMGAVSVLFWTTYRHASFPDGLNFLEALYAVITMLVLQPVLPLPGPGLWYLEVFYLLLPLVGIILAGQGVVNFISLLFNRHARAEEWQVAVASTYSGHVIVAGLGHLGFRIVKELLALGEQVVAVELNPEAEMRARVVAWEVPVLVGDARRAEVLEHAGVTHAAAIVVCTDDDLANIEIGVRARDAQQGIRVVLRMFDDDFAKRLARQLGFETALSTSALSAPAFAGAAVSTEISQSFYIDDQVLSAARITVQPRSQLAGRTVGAVEGELDLSVLLYRNAEITDLHPDPERLLAAGDELIVFADLRAFNLLTQLNKTPRL